MKPETEQNAIDDVPTSRPTLSFESIMKDLQDLSKNVATKNEVAVLEAKIKKLRKEKKKIKADLLAKESELAATDKKQKLYYNLFNENVKIVAELKAENESLKAKIEASQSSLTGENRVRKNSTSSIESAIPVCEKDLTHNQQPSLAICNDNSDDIHQNESTRPTKKRTYYDDDTTVVNNELKKQSLYSRPLMFDFFHKKWGKKLSLRVPPRFDES